MPNLLAELAKVRTEEDVKDAYIKALGLKKYNKGLVDIQTEEIWFEAKESATPPVLMFAQLLFYVRGARKAGERIPPFLCVIDREKAAIMETERALPIFTDKSIVWPKSASSVDKVVAAQVATYIETHFVVYKIETHEKEFVRAVKDAVKAGKLIRMPITPANLRQVFDRWVAMIGVELEGVKDTDYALLFFADIMHDGKRAAMEKLPARLLHDGDKPLFLLNGTTWELSSDRGYRNFWAIYHRPPDENYRASLLERRDSLLPIKERSFKGAYYTPLHIVDEAYNLLSRLLGVNWQQEYIVWDMCCGAGNLEVKHSYHRNVFMSTLDMDDIKIMETAKTCVAATKFEYDYLNDDITVDGKLDYTLTNKMPLALRQAIADTNAGKKGAKKIIVLINPPYAEAMNADNTSDAEGENAEAKSGVASTKIGATMDGLGYAARELFVQFMVRISREIPGATLAMFSKLKYINSPNFDQFRARWQAKYLGGFVVPSKQFESLKGNFPIGFLVWDTSVKELADEIVTEVWSDDGIKIPNKTFYRKLDQKPLSEWIVRPRSNKQDALPLKNAMTPTTSVKDVRGRKWADGAIGSMIVFGNDVQHGSDGTALLSSGYGNAGAFFVTQDNLWQAAIVFTVRRITKKVWINDRDQFLQANKPLTDEFKTDCLVWMLFNTSNLSAGADGLEWNGKKWSLVNHFIPFSEADIGSSGRFESDFMYTYLAGVIMSTESTQVMEQGKKLWRKFHSTRYEKRIRDEFRLNRPDAGWYQIRRSIEANQENESVDLLPFKLAYQALTEKLRPQIPLLGFMR